ELPGGHQLPSVGRADVGAHEPDAARDVLLVAARQIVQHDDLPALLEIRLRNVGSDEPRPARHQHPPAHALRLAMIAPTGECRRNGTVATQYRYVKRG